MKWIRIAMTIGGLFLLVQTIVFRQYLFPFGEDHIKVKGLACTCPDEAVLEGQEYLEAITPDSLKHHDLDYSEIWVTERPSVSGDYMGTDTYLIKGEVIGIDRVSERDRWNPVIRVDKWKVVDPGTDWVLRLLILGQMLILIGIFMLPRVFRNS